MRSDELEKPTLGEDDDLPPRKAVSLTQLSNLLSHV